MPDTFQLDAADNPDLAALKDKQPGEKCSLKDVQLTITSNDNGQLSGTIDEAELGDDYESSDSGDTEDSADKSSTDEGGEMGGMGMMGKQKKPIAVIAIGMGKKK